MKQQHRVLVAVLIGLLALASASACGPAQAPPAAPKAEAPPAAKPAAAPLVLKFSDPSAQGTARTDAFEWWGKEIEKRTQGRVQVQFYWSESLAKARDNIDAAKGGIADLVFAASWSYWPSVFPVWAYSELLFLGDDQLPHQMAAKEMYQTFPELRQEADNTGLKLLWVGSTPPTVFISRKPIAKLEDFKGLKMRAVGSVADWAKSLGATPSPITFYETYEALQKGTVEASQSYVYTITPYKFQEVTKYLTLSSVWFGTYAIFMNKDVWNKLAPADQKVLEDLWGELSQKNVELHDQSYDSDIKKLKDAGMEVIALTPDEDARWRASGKFTWDKWIKAMEGKGIDGKKMLDQYAQFYKKYERKR